MLEKVAEGIHCVATPHVMMGLHLGTRMTVVRLTSGELLVHSPVAVTPELRKEIDALGVVRYVVAPNLFHHVYAGEFASAYPEADLYAPRALRKKRPDLKIHGNLEDPLPFASDLEPRFIAGCMLQETVFLHRATRTLVTVDLCENFTTSPDLFTRLYLKASGIHGRVGWGKPLRLMYRDRRRARASIDALLEDDFDRLVISHGALIETGAKDAITRTFEGWLR